MDGGGLRAGTDGRDQAPDGRGIRQIHARRIRCRARAVSNSLGTGRPGAGRESAPLRDPQAPDGGARGGGRFCRCRPLPPDGHQLAREHAGPGRSQDHGRPAAGRGVMPRHEGLRARARPGEHGAGPPRPSFPVRERPGGGRLQPHGADPAGAEETGRRHQPSEHGAADSHQAGRAAGPVAGVRSRPDGAVQTALRAYDKAEEAFRHALVIRESLFGKMHPDLIATVDGLAYAFFGEKKFDEAEPVYQRLVGLWVSSVGPEHPMVAMALDKVAIFYSEQKKYDQAKEASDRATAIRAHFLGNGLAEQAAGQLSEGNKDAAVALYRRTLSVLDPPNPIYAEMRGQIEEVLNNIAPMTSKALT